MDEKNKSGASRPVPKNTARATNVSTDSDMSRTRIIKPIPDKKTSASRQSARKGRRRETVGYVTFFVSAVFVGVMLCVFVFSMVFNSVTTEIGAASPTITPGISAKPKPTPSAAKEKPFTVLAKIREVNHTDKKYLLQNMGTGESNYYYVKPSTLLNDKYGNNFAFAEFKIGDIVNAAFEKGSYDLDSLKASSQAIAYNVSDVTVDAENRVLTIGNDKFSYNDNLICLYNKKKYNVADIDPVDQVSINVFQNYAEFIEITKAHGTISIKENTKITNGSVEINTNIYPLQDKPLQIKTVEGLHKVIVNGSNIEPFIQEATVVPGETVELTLDEVSTKAGAIVVKVDMPGAKVKVNDEIKTANEPIILSYGTYKIKVEKEGYEPFTTECKLDIPQLNIDVRLKEVIKEKSFTIETTPPDAKVYLDGKLVGSSPITIKAEYGSYMISIVKEGYGKHSFPVNVGSKTPNMNIVLQPEIILAD